MNRQARSWVFLVSLTLCLILGVDAQVATGQETTADQQASTQKASQDQQSTSQPDRSVSLRKLPENILQDQKSIFLFPKELARGKHWWPTIGVLGVTAGL